MTSSPLRRFVGCFSASTGCACRNPRCRRPLSASLHSEQLENRRLLAVDLLASISLTPFQGSVDQSLFTCNTQTLYTPSTPSNSTTP